MFLCLYLLILQLLFILVDMTFQNETPWFFYCSTFYGYADDLILLTPNVRSLTTFLNVCKENAIEYNVSFKPAKSKSIIMSHSHSSPFVPEILSFMNDHIEVVRYDKHLGNYIGNIS